MKRDLVNINFNTAINEKIPNRRKLATLLMEILHIEKEAIYRRLRLEVPFSFGEVALVAERLGISLDQLVGIDSHKQRPFTLQLTDFENPGETDFIMWENYINIQNIFKEEPSFAICETWTTLPFPLCYKFPLLTQFYIFKWTFQTKNSIPSRKFESIHIDKKLLKLGLENLKGYCHSNHTQMILDINVFKSFVDDLHFFASIQLINPESIKLIMDELMKFTAYLESIAVNGAFPETNRKVSIYLSGVKIDSSYSIIEARDNYITMLHTLVLNAVATTDETTYHHIMNWFTAIKRLSTLISVSGEKERIEFFKKQKEIIEGSLDNYSK